MPSGTCDSPGSVGRGVRRRRRRRRHDRPPRPPRRSHRPQRRQLPPQRPRPRPRPRGPRDRRLTRQHNQQGVSFQMPPGGQNSRAVDTAGRCGGHAAGGHRRPEPGDRVRSKPAPGAGTPCPVRHQPGAGPSRGHDRTGATLRPRRPRTCQGRAPRGPGPRVR